MRNNNVITSSAVEGVSLCDALARQLSASVLAPGAVSLLSPAPLRRTRSGQCHGWVSGPLASPVQRRPTGGVLRNYVAKRPTNGVIYLTWLFMRLTACVCVCV